MRRQSTPKDMDDLQSPFDSVFKFIPQGHEKALKHALYNALAILVMVICVAGAVALFYILDPFIKPLLWALLCGSVLYPFKLALSDIMLKWLNDLGESSTPLVFGLVLAPVQVVDSLSEWALLAAIRRWKFIMGLLSFFVLLVTICDYTPGIILWIAESLFFSALDVVESLVHNLSIPLVSAILIGHLIAVGLWWYKPVRFVESSVPDEFSNNMGERLIMSQRPALQACATLVWAITGGYLLGEGLLLRNEEYKSLRTPAFLIFSGLLISGLLMEMWEQWSVIASKTKRGETSPINFLKWGVFLRRSTNESVPDNLEEEMESTENMKQSNKEYISEEVSGSHLNECETIPPKLSKRNEGREEFVSNQDHHCEMSGESSSSRKLLLEGGEKGYAKSYTMIRGVMWACVFIQFFKNPWILQLFVLPLSLCLLHRTCVYFEVWLKICKWVKPLKEHLYTWYKIREDALFPLPVRGVFKLMSWLNKTIMASSMQCVNATASLAVMIALIIFGITGLVFFLLQSYGEVFHMMQVCGSVINSTIVNNPELSAYLPEGTQSMVDNTLNNAYVYGREGIVSLIRGVFGAEKSEVSGHVESQVLELWDRVYQAWVMGGGIGASVGPKVTDDAVQASWADLLDTVKKTPGLMNFNVWSQFAQENLETLVSLLNSLWLLLKGNITVFFTIMTTLISIVFGGGSAVFGFLISMVVFLTALFYLLNSSSKQYKPVELISILSPVNGPRIGRAFEAAIHGVFEASFKMALFYGLWTWFIHNLFQMQVVYIPSVLAAVLAAVPFLGVYWASLPAVLDLWLAQGKGIQAILIFLAILSPCSVVDTTIYKEIKSGGHPYLTGLSIAGGIFCLGAEGAIMGPMLLCCLRVFLDLSTNLIKDSASETSKPLYMRKIRRKDSVS